MALPINNISPKGCEWIVKFNSSTYVLVKNYTTGLTAYEAYQLAIPNKPSSIETTPSFNECAIFQLISYPCKQPYITTIVKST